MIHVFLILFEALFLFGVTAAEANKHTVRAHKENWLVFISFLTLETCQIVLITTKIVNIGLGSESVITTQTTC